MPITVNANPARLTWANFTTVLNLTDPNDGTVVDAVTEFNYNIPNMPPRTVNGMQALAQIFQITITPNARVRTGITQTAGLLAHEQLHYDVGIAIARQLARELENLRAPDLAGLRTALQNAVTLHFHTRARLIQNRYDIDSRHGTNAHYQQVWARMITDAIANPRSTKIGGFYL
jgi:hypothetical protein